MTNEYFVYILRCNNNFYYKGITSNLDKRLRQYQLGQCCSTRNKNPEIVFVQVCFDRAEARVLEKYLKSGVGREIISSII